MATEYNDRIVPLDELNNFEIADGDPDVRGWEVYSSDGRKIGEVDELLVDTTAMKVRYLDVDIDDEFDTEDRHILLPIGYARLDENSDRILCDELQSSQVVGLPAYTGVINTDYENTLNRSLNPSFRETENLYESKQYDENRFYKRGSTQADVDTLSTTQQQGAAGLGSTGLGASGVGSPPERVGTGSLDRDNLSTPNRDTSRDRATTTPGLGATSPRTQESSFGETQENHLDESVRSTRELNRNDDIL